MALFLAHTVFAAELAVPMLTGRVVDNAGVLSGGDLTAVEQAIQGLERTTGGQMVVLTVPSLNNDALESFSLRVAEKWKIGCKGQDNGLLLVIARDNHKIRIEVGYGWEGKINDARAGDIIRGMGPYFRGNHFGDGMVYAVRQVEGFITGKASANLPAPPVVDDKCFQVGGLRSYISLLVLALFVIYIVISMVVGRRGGRTYGGGGYYGGWSGGGGSFGGGGFSGGGGSFGGGGASGSW